MKLIVANRDRSADLGVEIQHTARAREGGRAPRRLAPEHSALYLREAGSEEDYLRRFLSLLRIRAGLDTGPFPIPTKPGRTGRAIAAARRFLWKLLRYQHDRMAFQQSALDHLLTNAMEFERTAREAAVRRLEERVSELERRAADAGASERTQA